jgi:hypothetical protein
MLVYIMTYASSDCKNVDFFQYLFKQITVKTNILRHAGDQ